MIAAPDTLRVRRPLIEAGVVAACCGLAAAAAAGGLRGTLAAAFVVPALTTLIVLARKWQAGVGILFGLASVDGFIKHLHPSIAAYLMKDVIVAALYAGALLPVLARPQKPIRANPIVWAWVAFVVFFLLEGLRGGDGVLESVAGFREHLLFSGLLFVGALAARAPRFTRYIDVAVVCIGVACVFGLVQIAMGDAWLALSPTFARIGLHYRTFEVSNAGVTVHFYRAFGTLVDPAALGNAAAYGCILTFASFARWGARARVFGAALALVDFAALVFSASRTSMFGLAVGIVVLFALSGRPRNARASLLIFTSGALAFALVAFVAGRSFLVRFDASSRNVATTSRLGAASRLVARIGEAPFGLGLGSSGAGGRLAQRSSDALLLDDLYLAYLYEGGPLGLVVFTTLQGALLFAAVRRARSAPRGESKTIWIALAAGQSALLASGLTNQGVIDYAPVCQIFWFLEGALLFRGYDEKARL